MFVGAYPYSTRRASASLGCALAHTWRACVLLLKLELGEHAVHNRPPAGRHAAAVTCWLCSASPRAPTRSATTGSST